MGRAQFFDHTATLAEAGQVGCQLLVGDRTLGGLAVERPGHRVLRSGHAGLLAGRSCTEARVTTRKTRSRVRRHHSRLPGTDREVWLRPVRRPWGRRYWGVDNP